MWKQKKAFAFVHRARICKPVKEPGNQFPAWRNRFLGSLNVYKFGLCTVHAHCTLSQGNIVVHTVFNYIFNIFANILVFFDASVFDSLSKVVSILFDLETIYQVTWVGKWPIRFQSDHFWKRWSDTTIQKNRSIKYAMPLEGLLESLSVKKLKQKEVSFWTPSFGQLCRIQTVFLCPRRCVLVWHHLFIIEMCLFLNWSAGQRRSRKQEPKFCKRFKEPRNRFQGINSAGLCSMAGRYDNTMFLSHRPAT